MKEIPTVVVHITDGGMLEAVCADVEVRVILVDHNTGKGTLNTLDGDVATIWARRLPPDAVRTADYVRAADLPEHAWAMSLTGKGNA